jgi:hypothetical protein
MIVSQLFLIEKRKIQQDAGECHLPRFAATQAQNMTGKVRVR